MASGKEKIELILPWTFAQPDFLFLQQRIACCLAIRDIIKRNNGLRLRYHDRLRVNKAGPSCSSADNKMDVDEPADETQLDDHNNECDEPDLHRLWTQLFRVMDDVHEGTRLAAEGTAKQLSKVISNGFDSFFLLSN